jgi:hypothetical protein
MSFTGAPNTPTQINYRLVGGPYYRIYINQEPGPNYTSLPEWLAKQVKSVEITEVDGHGNDNQSIDMAIITMIDAYENVTNQSNDRFNAGIITGKPGNLLDLVITSNNQIRVLTQAELNQRKQAYVQSLKTIPQTVITLTNNIVVSAQNVSGGQLLTLLNPLPSQINFVNTNLYIGNIIPTSSNAYGIITDQPSPTEIIVSNLSPPFPTNQSIQQVVTLQSKQTQQVPVPQPVVSNAVPKFLFQEGNNIDIEWGYHSSGLKRRMRFVIQYVEYDAPETSSPEVKIYAVPRVFADLNKLRPSKGLTFTQPTNTTSGNITNNDKFAGDIVKTLAQSLGYKAIVSSQISNKNRLNTNDIKPPEFTKTITPEDSIYAYLQKLAKEIGFHFFVGYNFTTQKDTIFFISDEDFSKYSSFNFVWKGPNTLLTSYKINSDFGRLHAGVVVPVGSTASPSITHSEDQATLTLNLYTGTSVSATQIGTQLPNTVQTGTQNIFKDGVTGVSLYTPIDQPSANNILRDQYQQKSENAIILTGTLIGHPNITPCIGRFTNIGKRYSGRYMLINVKHIIDNSGYKIQFTASTNVVADALLDSNKENGQKDQASQYDTINLSTGQNLGVLSTQVSNIPGSGTLDASNFNSSTSIPGKVLNTSGNIGISTYTNGTY